MLRMVNEQIHSCSVQSNHDSLYHERQYIGEYASVRDCMSTNSHGLSAAVSN